MAVVQQAVDRQIGDAAEKTNALWLESSQRSHSRSSAQIEQLLQQQTQLEGERRQQDKEVKDGRDTLLRELDGIETRMAALVARGGSDDDAAQTIDCIKHALAKVGSLDRTLSTIISV